MNVRRLTIWLAATLGVATSAAVAATDDEFLPGDFAYGWELFLGAGDLQRVTLTEEVYAAARAADLADVRILDARGRAVPRFVYEPEPKRREARLGGQLPVFPVGVNQRDADVVARVSVETGAAPPSRHTSVSVVTNPATPAGEVPAHWIAVLGEREQEENAAAIRLAWPSSGESFVGSLRIEASEDLETWHEIGHGAIGNLGQDVNRIVHDRVPLHGRVRRYLRITPRELPASFQPAGVQLEAMPAREALVHAWRSTPLPARGSTAELDLGAVLPIDRFEVVPAREAGLVHARLRAREKSSEPWRMVGDAVFYRLAHNGRGLASDPAELPRTRARYWQLELAGGAAFDGEWRLGWRPAELVFLAQGEPPYTLFAGSARHAKASADLERLDAGLRDVWTAQRLEAAGAATLGKRETAGGESAYSPSVRGSWRVLVLWALLIAGVAFVGWMAWSIARGLRNTAGTP